jgi:hypothetical protein
MIIPPIEIDLFNPDSGINVGVIKIELKGARLKTMRWRPWMALRYGSKAAIFLSYLFLSLSAKLADGLTKGGQSPGINRGFPLIN